MGWNTKKHNLAPNAGTCLVCTNTNAKKYDLMLIGHTDTGFKKGTAAERPFTKTKEYVAHLEELAKKNGMEFNHSLRGGLSDANIITPCGVICIDGLGPMGDHVHTPDEKLNIDSIIPNYNLSMMMIEDLANNRR